MRHVEGPDELNRLGWPVVVQPGLDAEAYRLALLRLEEANRVAPGNFSLIDSLGFALVGELATGPLWPQVAESAEALDEAEKRVGSKAAHDPERTIRNLQTLARALHDSIESHKVFPPPAILSADSRALLSGRVELLPYLGQKELPSLFHLDEPWDSRHNQPLAARMPDVFATTAGSGSTHFRIFTGPKTAFPAAGGLDVASIRDGVTHARPVGLDLLPR